MITWTINYIPVNINSMAAKLLNHQALLHDIGEVISESFKVDKEFDDLPDGVCRNCGKGEVTHSPGLCSDCVEGGLSQCECCKIHVDLTYLFDKHGVTVQFRDE